MPVPILCSMGIKVWNACTAKWIPFVRPMASALARFCNAPITAGLLNQPPRSARAGASASPTVCATLLNVSRRTSIEPAKVLAEAAALPPNSFESSVRMTF